MNELALFAGAGGGILGGHLLGWRCVCAVELDPYAREVLMARQNDGCLPPFPIWDDVRTFDGRPWRGVVDIITGGFPCQDVSCAGTGAGIEGARSGLWKEFARAIREIRPRHVLVENSPVLTARGLGRVLGDLAKMGYDATWGVFSAADAGAPHLRERIWILAHAQRLQSWQRHDAAVLGRRSPEAQQARVGGGAVADAHGFREPQPGGDLAEIWQRIGHGGEVMANANRIAWHEGRASDAEEEQRGRDAYRGGECAAAMEHPDGERCEEQRRAGAASAPLAGAECAGDVGDADGVGREEPGRLRQPLDQAPGGGGETDQPEHGGWWAAEPDVGRMAHGVAARVDRLRCLGNGQVPAVVRIAWENLNA